MRRGIVAGLFLGLAPLTAAAATLQERVEALEKRDAELYHTLEEKRAAGRMSLIAERISISGLIELEAMYERLDLKGGGDESSSDLVLATAQLGIGAEVTDHLAATLILLYEEDEAAVTVDEATLDYSRDNWSSRMGRQYLPFGAYPSHFLSSPLTNELGETQNTALLLGFEQEWFAVSAFLFNGPAGHTADVGHLNDWGVSVAATPVPGVEFGVSFLSDLADSGAELVPGMNYAKRVPGWSAYGIAALGPVEILGEVLGATTAFSAVDLDGDGDGSGDRPWAWNLEVSTEVGESVEVAARIEGSDEFTDQPELQYGACVSWSPWENVSTSLEILRGEFDDAFGGGADSRTLFTAQLAAEF